MGPAQHHHAVVKVNASYLVRGNADGPSRPRANLGVIGIHRERGALLVISATSAGADSHQFAVST
jgi:hypothetical protein